ncbi:hypothetical protein AYI70_g8251, partial [Smittium culicis]
IRKPVKRARSLFSDIVKGDDPEYANKAELTSTNVNSTSVIDKSKSDTQYLNQKTPKKIQIQQNQQKNAGSDQKIGIDWGQFKGDVPEALDVVSNTIGDSIYTRYDDYRANVTYITLDKLEDATNLMSKTLNYDDQKIDLYQTVKIEEDIMAVNIPNFKEISITKMIELVTKQLKTLGEIKDISALCNKYRNEYIPYGMKVLFRKNTIDTELPLFLDHEDGRINIFYRGFKEACSYCKKDGHWKSECPTLKNITSKKKFMSDMAKSSLKFSLLEPTKVDILTPPALIINKDDPKTSTKSKFLFTKPVEESKITNDTKVSSNDEDLKNKTSTINCQRGTLGLKKPPANSLIAAETPISPIEKVSSSDDTESDVSTDNNNQPLIKCTTKSNINSDDFSYISMNSDMSSPMEIKKEFVPPNSSPTNDSEGYSPPSEHALMAAKARMG